MRPEIIFRIKGNDLRFDLFKFFYFENTNLSIYIGSTVGTTENESCTFGKEVQRKI